MNNEEKNSYVKTRITDTLIELMHYKPFNDISISELTNLAGVGRVSFYRNYDSLEDILSKYISLETDKWINQSGFIHISIPASKEYVISLLKHLYDYRDFIDLLLKNDIIYLLEKEFDERINEHLKESENPWMIAYTTGGFYKLFLYWAKTEYQLKPEEIAAFITE